MKRQIFEVYAKIVDANGSYNTLSGYPKTFDSRTYAVDDDDGIDKALLRARGELYDTAGAMCKRDDRQLQTVILMSADGFILDRMNFGEIADVEQVQS